MSNSDDPFKNMRLLDGAPPAIPIIGREIPLNPAPAEDDPVVKFRFDGVMRKLVNGEKQPGVIFEATKRSGRVARQGVKVPWFKPKHMELLVALEDMCNAALRGETAKKPETDATETPTVDV